MDSQRPPIPVEIKREIRRRCGFGCVICGRPLYTYEHMEGWAKVRRHVASEMTLLCDNHQRERTNDLLPIEEVRSANQNPHNLRKEVSKAFLLNFAGPRCELIIGSNVIRRTRFISGSRLIGLVIDGTPLVGFNYEGEELFLSMAAFDDAGNQVLSINQNELLFAPTAWDITFEGRRFTIRTAPSEFLIDVVFVPPFRIVIERGLFSFNGMDIKITPDAITNLSCGGSSSYCVYEDLDVAISAGETRQGMLGAIHFPRR